MPAGFSYSFQSLYDSAEFTLGVVTDSSVKTPAQTLFVNCTLPTYVSIRADQNITVKFNSISNPAITISANTAFGWDFQFFDLFITTTVGTNVKISFKQVA